MNRPLSFALLAAAPAAGLEASDALEDTLAGMLREARAQLSEVGLDDATFLGYLAARLPTREAAKALSAIKAADLYLACACSRGDPRALAEFDRRLLPAVARKLLRMASAEASVDDLTQQLRAKLFVGAAGQPPRIAEYSGRGPLAAWVAATAARLAIDQHRTVKEQVSFDDQLASALPAQGEGTEQALLKQQVRDELQRAVRAALAELPARERTMLRMQHVEGLGFDQIGAFYRVHKSTICRWLAAARAQVLERSQAMLAQRLKLGDAELESVLRVARSQLDLSVVSCLRATVSSNGS